MNVITEEINFLAKRKNSSISNYTNCISKYTSKFDEKVGLKSKTPVFLDTNVILRYYSISFTAREKLYKFIKENNAKIILTNQVQYEFIKNREDVIQKFFEQVTDKVPKDFKSDLVNKAKSFLDTHKTVLKDYPFVETGIEKYQTTLNEILEKLNKDSLKKRKENKDLLLKDKFLNLLNSCKSTSALEKGELEVIVKGFDYLKDKISLDKIDTILSKSDGAFPGLGDIKMKPEDPYGDYIIYHEIMKYMITNKTDAIFLTFDNTKGDWMSKTKTPYLHYLLNMSENTGHLFYVLDAERILEEKLKTNIQSLVISDTLETSHRKITVSNLEKLFETHDLFFGVKKQHFNHELVKELGMAGYNSMDEIENDLRKGKRGCMEYTKNELGFKYYVNIGILRITLRLVNPNYTKYIYQGKTEAFRNEDLSQYQTFLTD